jgi:hypothetical protein
MKHLDKRTVAGWIAVGLSIVITCFWAFWGIIAASLLATEVSAQQGVRWEETSVEGAKRRAAQTGRLVLVHFRLRCKR